MSNVACCLQAFRFSGLVHPGDLIHDAANVICVSIRLLCVLARIKLSLPLFSLLLFELSIPLFDHIERGLIVFILGLLLEVFCLEPQHLLLMLSSHILKLFFLVLLPQIGVLFLGGHLFDLREQRGLDLFVIFSMLLCNLLASCSGFTLDISCLHLMLVEPFVLLRGGLVSLVLQESARLFDIVVYFRHDHEIPHVLGHSLFFLEYFHSAEDAAGKRVPTNLHLLRS